MKFTRETLGALLDETVGVIGEGVTLAELTPGLRWLRRERELKGLRARWEEYFRVVMDDRVVKLEMKKKKKGGEREEEETEMMVDVLLGLEGDKKLSNEAIMGILLVSEPWPPLDRCLLDCHPAPCYRETEYTPVLQFLTHEQLERF